MFLFIYYQLAGILSKIEPKALNISSKVVNICSSYYNLPCFTFFKKVKVVFEKIDQQEKLPSVFEVNTQKEVRKLAIGRLTRYINTPDWQACLHSHFIIKEAVWLQICLIKQMVLFQLSLTFSSPFKLILQDLKFHLRVGSLVKIPFYKPYCRYYHNCKVTTTPFKRL